MADGENDKPSSGASSTLGSGKDLLFGWLVGRAAADLGLAQALAASEAQRIEQFKRLEESLLAQIRDLQNQPNIGADVDMFAAELLTAKSEFDNVSERLGRLEMMTQQAVQSRDQLKSEAALLQAEIERQKDLLRAQQDRFQDVEHNLAAKFQDLAQQIRSQPEGTNNTDTKLEDLRLELRNMADQVARTEFSAQQMTAQWSNEIERAASEVKGSNAALRAELFEHLQKLQTAAPVVSGIQENVEKRFGELRRELGENTATRINVEVQGLRAELQSVMQRLESLSLAGTPQVDLNAEREHWQREGNEILSARLHKLTEEISDKLHEIAGAKVDREDFQMELGALAERIARSEQSTLQTANGLKHELSSIQAGLSRQQQQQQATEAVIKGVEETIRAKFAEIQNYLVQQQGSLQIREDFSTELKVEMQTLAQRLGAVESTAHHTHALMVNENQQTAQLREGFRADLADLRGRLDERPPLDAVIEQIEDNLDVRTRELQNQLAQTALAVDRREHDFRDFGAQLQTVNQKMAQLETVIRATLSTGANQSKETVVTPVDLSALRLGAGDRRGSVVPRLGSAPLGAHGVVNESGGSEESPSAGGKDQISQLHERISADIERARAELREKSGRWKVRR